MGFDAPLPYMPIETLVITCLRYYIEDVELPDTEALPTAVHSRAQNAVHCQETLGMYYHTPKPSLPF